VKDRLPYGNHGTNIKATIKFVERRSAPRKHFIAEAQIVELRSGAKLSARSCDLVARGCYVDTLNTFSIGTLVRIRLKKGKTVVEANGNVVYRVPGLGMGISFHNLLPESQETLEQWLSQMPGEPDLTADSLPPLELDEPAGGQQPAGQVGELVQMLMKKGILTRAEAAILLKEPIDQ
jgi:hypothetical protein